MRHLGLAPLQAACGCRHHRFRLLFGKVRAVERTAQEGGVGGIGELRLRPLELHAGRGASLYQRAQTLHTGLGFNKLRPWHGFGAQRHRTHHGHAKITTHSLVL